MVAESTLNVAIDFGTSNTVVSVWDKASNQSRPIYIPNLSRIVKHAGTEMYVVPSLIHFTGAGKFKVGEEVRKLNAEASPNTFKRMKSYVRENSPVSRVVHGQRMFHQDAAKLFLKTITDRLCAELRSRPANIAITVPVDAFEAYNKWLLDNLDSAESFRLIDEPVAAALGYGVRSVDSAPLMVFDFGGGTVDLAVVVPEFVNSDKYPTCRVIAKAGLELGGEDIDEWLAREVLRRCNVKQESAEAEEIWQILVHECQQLKEKLSVKEVASILVMNPTTGRVIESSVTRAEFEKILHANGVFQQITQCINSVLRKAAERGFAEGDLARVIMVGGGSLIPAVQNCLTGRFGARVLLENPLEAVAKGATMLLAGVQCVDYIQHCYAVKSRSGAAGAYEYHVIVPSGTAYPSASAIAEKQFRATTDGQTKFGLEIFEISLGAETELQSSPSKLAKLSQQELEKRRYSFLNADSATFIFADPPAMRGESRFKVEFFLDENRRLVITSRDLKTGRLLHTFHPIIKLR